MSERYDIIGGGPAGCVAAKGLTAAGYRTALITRDRRPAVIEGLSARVIQAIRDLGFLSDDAVPEPPVAREASWQGLTSSTNREWLVDRQRLDHAFRRETAAAGVAMIDARIARIGRTQEAWTIAAADGRTWRAGFLIEARGRAAGGRRLRGPSTTALSRPYRRLAPCARSAVAAWRRGWAWFATLGDGTGSLQLAFASPLPKRDDLSAFWDQAIGEIDEANDWLHDAEPAAGLAVRHAETSRVEAVIAGGVIRIGDAALAMDPLAGHGVFEAVASATSALPVVRTILERPDHTDAATRFYQERIDQTFLRLARIGRDFYALERRWPDEPFWGERRSWPDQEPAHARPGAPSPAPAITTRPVVEDGFIAEREVIVTADHPRGVWQVDRVPIVDLLLMLRAGAPPDPDMLAEAFGRTPAEIETALGWLRFRGLAGGEAKNAGGIG
ncbi:MAG: tryptophan 7-halogenase [Alphaproteobacteria bacterium]